MENLEVLVADVSSGRRAIRRILHECTGSGAVIVTFEDGEEFPCSSDEARELLDARAAHLGTTDAGLMDSLFDSLG
jgi:hypothetical protein